MHEIYSNVVGSKNMHDVQLRTLETLKDSLIKSFGPNGSNTMIVKKVTNDGSNYASVVNYTKDGHTILGEIQFLDILEHAVKENITDITTNIVKTVGDGTTSAVILSYFIYKEILDYMEQHGNKNPYSIMRELDIVVSEIKSRILGHAKEFNAEAAKKISLISTNGNTEISEDIYKIYKEFGNDVYIDLGISPSDETLVKIYDGLTLETGYAENAFINNEKGTSRIRNANVYIFNDPIDTPEMAGLMDTIIMKNILEPSKSKETVENVKPTVIIAPKISRDFSAYMTALCNAMYKTSLNSKLPILIITNVYNKDMLNDLGILCGCKTISKYIDPQIQKIDIEKGLAPTLETVVDFGGKAELVEADSIKTKFINPEKMYEEGTTNYSTEFNNLILFLEQELEKQKQEKNITRIAALKKRIQSLKSNLVEYLVGGISISDRDQKRDLAEDAIKNCRSASKKGVGAASNVEGLIAVKSLHSIATRKELNTYMYSIISNAYENVIKSLLETSDELPKEVDLLIQDIVKKQAPFNIITNKIDSNVLSSIESDVIILDSVVKIISLMVTSNQFICPDVISNKYR